MLRLLRLMTLVGVLAVLVGCGGGNQPKPTAKKPTSPIVSAPTSNSAPTTSAEITPVPFASVVINGTTIYHHPSGLFQMSIPKDWEVRETSRPGVAEVTVATPGDSALIRITTLTYEGQLTGAELLHYLAQETRFGFNTLPDYSPEEPQEDDTNPNRVTMKFSYTNTVAGETQTMYGQLIGIHDDKYVTIFFSVLPESERARLESRVEGLFDSYRVDDSVKIP